MKISYRKARLSDIAQMQTLVAPEIHSGVILVRSDDELATNIRSYTVALEDDKIVAFNALHVHTPKLAEVRSLIVSEHLRGQGVGKKLILLANEEGVNLGLKEILVLTYQQAFFEALGFKEISKESIPEHKIWADCIKCKYFPVCNEVSLIKYL
ncbi:MAG: N-acetyltransferase [Campylobacterota bacterium]|nr:N-acetyltransferase [Campylobacterota bacterium]